LWRTHQISSTSNYLKATHGFDEDRVAKRDFVRAMEYTPDNSLVYRGRDKNVLHTSSEETTESESEEAEESDVDKDSDSDDSGAVKKSKSKKKKKKKKITDKKGKKGTKDKEKTEKREKGNMGARPTKRQENPRTTTAW